MRAAGVGPKPEAVGEAVFLECKRADHDRAQKTQVEWVTAALAERVSIESLIVVEWDFVPESRPA
jgi:hypothetical protein